MRTFARPTLSVWTLRRRLRALRRRADPAAGRAHECPFSVSRDGVCRVYSKVYSSTDEATAHARVSCTEIHSRAADSASPWPACVCPLSGAEASASASAPASSLGASPGGSYHVTEQRASSSPAESPAGGSICAPRHRALRRGPPSPLALRAARARGLLARAHLGLACRVLQQQREGILALQQCPRLPRAAPISAARGPRPAAAGLSRVPPQHGSPASLTPPPGGMRRIAHERTLSQCPHGRDAALSTQDARVARLGDFPPTHSLPCPAPALNGHVTSVPPVLTRRAASLVSEGERRATRATVACTPAASAPARAESPSENACSWASWFAIPCASARARSSVRRGSWGAWQDVLSSSRGCSTNLSTNLCIRTSILKGGSALKQAPSRNAGG